MVIQTRAAEWTAVDGVQAGARVIVQGAGFLGDGDRVRVAPAPRPAPAAKAAPAKSAAKAG